MTLLRPHGTGLKAVGNKIVYIKIDLREAAPDVKLPKGWDDMTVGWL